MGKREEGVLHLRNVCEIVEKISGKNTKELAKDLSNLKKALCFCLKAFEIYGKVFGDNSEEVAECRKQLAIIYCTLGEHEKSLEHSQLSQRVFKNLGCTSLLIRAEIEYAPTLKHLEGKTEEAVPYFEDFVGKMKESYGSKHCTIVYAYYNLGSNYAKINKPHSSTQVFACAKNIFDESFGPLHPDTIQAYTSLCRAYTSLGSYSLAIETLDMTVKHTMEAQVPDAQNDLAQAAILREKLKVKVAATEISESLTNLTFPKDDKSTSGKDSQTVTS